MKVISIGRESGCDIVLNDATDVISRRHAILIIYPSGKMTITDQGHNGTYVNGIRITTNTPFPVTRNDVVSFAHVMQLDWNLVPNRRAHVAYTAVGIITAIAVVVLLAIFVPWHGGFKHSGFVTADSAKVDSVAKKDSTHVAKKDSTAKKETVRKEASRKSPSKGMVKKKTENNRAGSHKKADSQKKNSEKDSKKSEDKVKQRIL